MAQSVLLEGAVVSCEDSTTRSAAGALDVGTGSSLKSIKLPEFDILEGAADVGDLLPVSAPILCDR